MRAPRAKTSVLQETVRRLRGDLLSGLVVIVPVWLTIDVILAALGMVESATRSLLPGTGSLEERFGAGVYALVLVFFVLATTAIGYLAKKAFGHRVLEFGEVQLNRFPVVRSIYSAFKQLVVTVFEKSDRSFQQTCLIEYPHKGKWAVGLIAGAAAGELPQRAGDPDLVAIFMPTTPNPITGFLFLVPRRDLVDLTMNLEDAAKLIISAGLISPAGRPAAGSGDDPKS